MRFSPVPPYEVAVKVTCSTCGLHGLTDVTVDASSRTTTWTCRCGAPNELEGDS